MGGGRVKGHLGEEADSRRWKENADFTYRSVGPMQFVSVLSISRRIRSCSAAVSMLDILHVVLDRGQADPNRTDPSPAE